MLTLSPQMPPVPSQPSERNNLSRVAWLHPEKMELAQWVAAGRRFGEIGRGSQWWIGDWLLFGTARFGERYVEASKITGYDPKSLRNMRYVAAQFDLSLRRDNLNWSHHALLAGLDFDERVYWLDRATADRLSVEDLRGELRAARRGRYSEVASAVQSPATLEGEEMFICPNCGLPVPVSSMSTRMSGRSGDDRAV